MTTAVAGIEEIGKGSCSAGDRFGPYQILRFIGRGGMGEVYEVVHTLLEKRFALKLISDSLSQDTEARDLFRREGREAGRLEHPNIVRVDDCSEDRGRLYLRMELIEGRDCAGIRCVTLTDFIIASNRKVRPAEAVPVLRDVLSGLGYAHKRGRVHRDIKPSNVLLTPEAAKIGDFGLVLAGARTGGDVTQMSEVVVVGYGAQSVLNAGAVTNSAAGTPDYMAPELLDGSAPPSYRTDVYSVGVLLLEMLTGSRRAGSAKPSQMLRGSYKLDSWWDELYARSTAFHEDRFADAREMLAFVEQHAGPAPVRPRPIAPEPASNATTLVAALGVGPERKEPPPAQAQARPVPAPPSPVSPPAPRVAANAGALADVPDAARISAPPARIDQPVPEKSRARGRLRWIPVASGALALIVVGLLLANRSRPPALEPNKESGSFQAIKPAEKTNSVAAFASPQKNPGVSVSSHSNAPAGGTNAPATSMAAATPPKPAQKVAEKPRGTSQDSPVARAGGTDPASFVKSSATNVPGRLVKPPVSPQAPIVTGQDSVAGEFARNGELEKALSLNGISLPMKNALQSLVSIQRRYNYKEPVELRSALDEFDKAWPNNAGEKPKIVQQSRNFVEEKEKENQRTGDVRNDLAGAITNKDLPKLRKLADTDGIKQNDQSLMDTKAAIKVIVDQTEAYRTEAKNALAESDFKRALDVSKKLDEYLSVTHQAPELDLPKSIATAREEYEENVQRKNDQSKVAEEQSRERAAAAAAATAASRTALKDDAVTQTSATGVGGAGVEKREPVISTSERLQGGEAGNSGGEGSLRPTNSSSKSGSSVPLPNQGAKSRPTGDSADSSRYSFWKTKINEGGNWGIGIDGKKVVVEFLNKHKSTHPELSGEIDALLNKLKNK